MPDGTFRFHGDGQDLGGMCMLGTFSQYAVISQNSCVKVDDDLDLQTVVLVGCGVTTGWGSAVYAAGVGAGETVVIYGIGGIKDQLGAGCPFCRRQERDRGRPAGQQA